MSDIEPTPEEVERWTRNLMKRDAVDKLSVTSPDEQKIIEKVFGTKTQAERFLKFEAKPSHAHARERRFRPKPVTIKFEYWDRAYGAPGGSFVVERYEDGRLVLTRDFMDRQKRDDMLIKLRGAGFSVRPVTVAGVVPEPIGSRVKITQRAKQGRAYIMSQIGKLTTEDLENEE